MPRLKLPPKFTQKHCPSHRSKIRKLITLSSFPGISLCFYVFYIFTSPQSPTKALNLPLGFVLSHKAPQNSAKKFRKASNGKFVTAQRLLPHHSAIAIQKPFKNSFNVVESFRLLAATSFSAFSAFPRARDNCKGS